MGLFDGSGGPMDFLRGRVDQWRAHPFQQIASTVAGGFGGPAAGFGANQLFNKWNDNQFNNSANQLMDRSQQQTNMDANSAMNEPLKGPLGNYDRQNPFGEPPQQGGASGGMAGGGEGGGFGGPQGFSGPTQSSQNWMGNTGGFQGIQNQLNGQAPQQSSGFVNDILNSLSTGPGQPGSGFQGSKHDQIMGGGMPANYGMSPMQVGGSNVIFGSPSTDMNSVAMANRRMWDH